MGWLTRPIYVSSVMKKDGTFEVWLKSQGFVISKKVFQYPSLYVDDIHKQFALSGKNKLFSFKDLLEFGDDKTILTYTEKQKGSTGKAVIGAVAFGVAGAVVGANMKKAPVQKSVVKNETHVLLNDLNSPRITFRYGDQEYINDKKVPKSAKIDELEGTLGYIKANAI